MGAADGVDANLLEVLEAAKPHVIGHGSSKSACIVMQTNAFNFHPASVERKALVRVELKGTQTDVDLIAINDALVLEERGAQAVEIRIVEVPAMGTAHIEAELVVHLGADFLLCHYPTIGIKELDLQFQTTFGLNIVDSHIDIDSGGSIGELGANPTGAPLSEVRLGSLNEPHVTIDARTRVPTAVSIAAVIDAYGNDVVACLEVGRHVIEERGKAGRTIAEQVAVQVNS